MPEVALADTLSRGGIYDCISTGLVKIITMTADFPESAVPFGALTALRCQPAIRSVLSFTAVLTCGALMFCRCWPDA